MKRDRWLKVELAALLGLSLVMVAIAAGADWQVLTLWH